MENQNTSYPNNDEIDLKAYIKTILGNWIWIVLVSLVAGIITFIFLTLQSEQYSSSSLVSVSSPSLDVEFDSNIRTTEGSVTNLQSNDLSSLALSDKVMVDLFEQVESEISDDIANHNELKDKLTVSTETRSDLIRLSGIFSDAELSAFVVNQWSELFVESANLFFEGSQEDSQRFLEDQLADARVELDSVNNELVEFQSRNTKAFVQTQLDSDRSLQQSYVSKRNALDILLYDIQGVKKQINQNPNDANALSDLTLYTLQNRAFGTGASIQLDITNFGELSSSTLESRIALLNGLETTVVAQQADIEGLLAGLEPLILFRQEQIESLTIEEVELESRRALINNTYDSLALKVAEAAIEQDDTSGRAQVASVAIVPIEPMPRNRVANSALAAIVAAMLAVGIILIRAWWIEDEEMSAVSEDVGGRQPAVIGYTNGRATQPINGNGNGNGIHPAETEKEDIPAND